MTHKRTLVVSIGLLALASLGAAIALQHDRPARTAWTTSRLSEPLTRPHSATLGQADAPVHLVKFLDPASSTARDIYPVIKGLVLTHPDKTQLSIRHAQSQRGSDQVSKMLEAARKQGRFWESLEVLLVFQSKWVAQQGVRADVAWKFLGASGLDMDRLRADMNSPEVAQVVAQDLADAKTLDVARTAGLFVNGKSVPGTAQEPLQALLQDAFASAPRQR